MKNQEQAKKYLSDRDYKMEVIKDNGVHRHLSFKHNDKHDGSFQITTWPGHLCMSGDMGCFVFSRIQDMTGFFSGGGISPSYWSEKCLAGASHNGGLKNFDFDTFSKGITEILSQRLDAKDYEEATVEKAKEALESLEWIEPDEYGAVAYLRELDSDLVELCDLPNFDVWNFHYLFACYAINFACNTYLAAKQEAETA